MIPLNSTPANSLLWAEGSPNNIYHRHLKQHVLLVLSRKPLFFNQVVRLAGGAFPTDVLFSLHTLMKEGMIIEQEGLFSLADVDNRSYINLENIGKTLTDREESAILAMSIEESRTILSDPHPADYDWRLTLASVRKLVDVLGLFIDRNARTALLGVPSIFPHLAGQVNEITLFDRSSSLISDLQIAGYRKGLVEHDLFEPFLDRPRAYDIAFADPPWYSEFFNAFILRSSELLKDFGILVLCVLPWLTRPNAIEDRSNILSFAYKAGFDLIDVFYAFLKYETPRFERAVLGLAGIECNEWRVGDLYTFRRVNNPTPGLDARRPSNEPEWDEFRFGALKVKVRRRNEMPGRHFSYKPVNNKNNILDSISRRSPNRAFIDYWTSGNRAYSVEGIDLLRASLGRLEQGESAQDIVQDIAIQDALPLGDQQALETLLNEVLHERTD